MLAHQVTRKQLTPESWATPASADAVGSHGGGQGRSLRTDIYNLKHRTEFPTPKANKAGGYSSANFSPTLEQVVNWPTATVCGNHNRNGASATSGDGLATAVNQAVKAKMYPTPTVQDGENNGGPSQALRHIPPLNAVVQGVLNPSWVENLMGFPQGWTDVSDSPPAPAKNSTNGKRREQSPVSCLTVQND
jgi:hypothetical protein